MAVKHLNRACTELLYTCPQRLGKTPVILFMQILDREEMNVNFVLNRLWYSFNSGDAFSKMRGKTTVRSVYT